jgi:hypothetical protein
VSKESLYAIQRSFENNEQVSDPTVDSIKTLKKYLLPANQDRQYTNPQKHAQVNINIEKQKQYI